MMEAFELKGEEGFIKIQIIELFDFPKRTSSFGGYDCVVSIEIRVFSYTVNSQFYTTTGELFQFYQELKKHHDHLNGNAVFNSYEGKLQLTVKYNLGKVELFGSFQESLAIDNTLRFQFYSDQSYFSSTLIQLERLVEKYGGMKGIELK